MNRIGKMPDMLVKLYTLPALTPFLDRLRPSITIRQAATGEKNIVAEWARQHFNPRWAAACEVAVAYDPISCWIAVRQAPITQTPIQPYDLPAETLIGFACYDVASKGMFGPTGVQESERGQGVGAALLVCCLHAMAAQRYAYAIIGQAGPKDFYAKIVGATVIEGSEPGIARGLLIGV
jgi:hypothetical protein